MFDGPIGKIILFWIFMIGALFFARVLGFNGDTKTTVIFLIACALIYVVWVIGRVMAKRRRENEEYTGPAPKKGKRR
ncbi:MAG: hypothetical protein IJ109_05465 [Firmicutes bacterium]|nr:hypothetical protein [Bacillota bacterium]